MKQKIDLNKGYIGTIYIEGTTPDGKTKTYTIKLSMLKPKSIEKLVKFTTHNLGVINEDEEVR